MAVKFADVEEVLDTEETPERSSAMRLEVMTFHIVGISPLLQNNPAEFIGNDSDELTTKKKKYNDEEEAILRLYKSPDGHYYHPSEAFPKALQRAASGKKIGKDFATNLVKMGVFVADPYCVIEGKNGKPLTKWGIDRRSVVIGSGKKAPRVLRCRPVWLEWQMHVALEIDAAIFNEDAIKQFLALAGRYPGIGDYRPEKGGGFGRFKVI